MRHWRYYLGFLAVGLGVALAIALLSPLASSDPDGLEKVAEEKQFMDQAKDAPYELIPDYLFPGIDNENVATILAGVTGVLAVAAVTLGVGFLLRRGTARAAEAPEERAAKRSRP